VVTPIYKSMSAKAMMLSVTLRFKPYWQVGSAAGLQRYRCKSVDCRRTFNALTKTPLARAPYG
jgi:hypothetical protein